MLAKTLTPPAFVAPLVFTFPVDELEVTVTALGIAQIAQVTALCAPVLDELMLLDPQALDRLENGSPNMDDLHEMLGLFNKHGTAAFDLVAIGTGLSRTRVEKLLPDRFAYLFCVVVLANADFFSRARPVFSAAGSLLSQVKPQESTGQLSSTP